MKRFLAVFLMLAILLTGLTVTANAASPWAKDAAGKWTYTKADGKLAEIHCNRHFERLDQAREEK